MIANRFIHCRNFHENTPLVHPCTTPNFPAPAAHPHSLQSTITNQPWKSHNLATGGKTSDHRDKFSGLAHSPTATYETRARKGSSRDNQGCEMNYDDGCKPRILRRRQVPERNRKIRSGSHLDAVGKKASHRRLRRPRHATELVQTPPAALRRRRQLAVYAKYPRIVGVN